MPDLVVKKVVLPLWEEHKEWRNCSSCSSCIGQLSEQNALVRGTLPCDVLFIGEAPGKTEAILGEPFVGASGMILNAWIRHAFEGTPLTYAVTNLVACRPTDFPGGPNRQPNLDEIENCRPRLHELMDIATPRAIVFIGIMAKQHFKWPGVLEFFVVHPAYVLRKGGAKAQEFRTAQTSLRNFIERNFLGTC